MNENYSADITATPKSTGTKIARAFLHMFTIGTALIGGLVSMLGFAAADCARRGAGFIGCGDGVPDPQGAIRCTVFAIGAAAVTILIVVGIQKSLANSR